MALAFESQQGYVCVFGGEEVFNICFLAGKGVYGGFGAGKKIHKCRYMQKAESLSVCV